MSIADIDIWEDINQAWDGMSSPRQPCSHSVGCKDVKRPTCEPRNNDGRKDCYWCAGPLRKVLGLNEQYDYCDKCKR